mmetsp:Transcript_149/g.197  ORF Transcript_149/g.197 Transcript_149/m.197 type:complete len:224 (-) Transcript_149:1818-2489(-)
MKVIYSSIYIIIVSFADAFAPFQGNRFSISGSSRVATGTTSLSANQNEEKFVTELDDFMSIYYPIVDRDLIDSSYSIFHGRIPHTTELPSSAFPPYHISEEEEQFLINVSIPGFKADDVNLQVEGAKEFVTHKSHPLFGHAHAIRAGPSILRVMGDREMDLGDQFIESSFEKSFVLAKCIDANRIKACIEKGQLIVSLPKAETDLTVRSIHVAEPAVMMESKQ